MTLLFFDGFQDALLHRKPEWDAVSAWAVAVGRDASTNGSATVGNSVTKTCTLSSAAATCITGTAFLLGTSSPYGGGTYYALGFVRAGTTELVVTVSVDGMLEVRRSTAGGTLLGTSSGHAPIPQLVWMHLQAKVLLHTSTGTCELLLNGQTVLTLTGVATAGTSGSVSAVSVRSSSNSGGNNFWDDMWICDAVDATATQGRANNTYLGDLKVTSLIPSANGDLTAWSKSTGTNAAALVDEVPPNTTDYIFSSTSAQRELMTLPDLAATAGSVYGVRVNFYGLKTDAGASSVKPLVKETGGTITAQTALPLSVTAAPYSGGFLFTKPSAPTTPWSASDVNALQAGVELA